MQRKNKLFMAKPAIAGFAMNKKNYKFYDNLIYYRIVYYTES